jgi:soluble lytic murein transglycosylase
VPSYDNLQTQVAVQPSVQFQAPSGPTAGGIAAEQGAQMGRAVQGLGADMNKLALAAAEQANQVRVTDAMNQAMSARLKLTYDPQVGYTQKRGQAALDPDADGKPMDQSYGDQLRTRLDEIAKGLGNDAQRAVFAQQSGQVVQQFNAGLTSHVAKEYADHAVSVQQGTTKLAQDQMGLAWGDATAIEQSRTAIKA